MEILFPYKEWKTLGTAEPGELIIMPFGREAMAAIATAVSDQMGGRVFILLPRDGTSANFLSIEDSDSDCLSLGVDWMLDLSVESDVYPGNGGGPPDSGFVQQDRSGRTVLVIGRHPQSGMRGPHELRFDTKLWKSSGSLSISSAVRFLRWRILLPPRCEKDDPTIFASYDVGTSAR